MAGAAGSLYAHYVKIIDPDIFLFIYTVTMVIMVITEARHARRTYRRRVIFGFMPVIAIVRRTCVMDPLRALMIVIVFVLPQGSCPRSSAGRELRRPARPVTLSFWRTESARRVTTQADIILSIEHVTVHFGGLIAISDLNFEVREGEIVGLIGPNGAGKTTAFNVITGFLKPTSGNVRYRTTSLGGLKPHEIARLGLVRTFQRTSVFQTNSVFQNVLIGLHDRGRSTLWDTMLALPRESRSEQELVHDANEILQLVGLEQRASELAGTLPYGEQRLLGIALALAVKPSMLLLDEPVSGMNASETARCMKLVEKISRLRRDHPPGGA